MKRNCIIIFILLLLATHRTIAQYDAQLSNYWAIPAYYNPGYAGKSGKLEATLLNRQQWIGFENAPKTMLIAGDMPFKFFDRTFGLGMLMISESLGLFSHSNMSLQAAFKKKLWKGDLSIGLQVGMINESFDGAKVRKIEGDDYHAAEDDGIPTIEATGTTIDFGAGLYYSGKRWYVGFSVTHLLEPEMKMTEKNFMDLPRGYYLMGGYNIQLNNPLLELQPSFFVKSTIQMTQFDVSARLIYNNLLWGGLGWRLDDAAIVMIGGQYKNIQAGYAYDFPVSAIRKGSTGSHEIFLKYITELDLGKGKKNKHKSVRIL